MNDVGFEVDVETRRPDRLKPCRIVLSSIAQEDYAVCAHKLGTACNSWRHDDFATGVAVSVLCLFYPEECLARRAALVHAGIGSLTYFRRASVISGFSFTDDAFAFIAAARRASANTRSFRMVS